MALIGKAEYGDVVSFEVYPANIIGNNFKEVKIVGIVDSTTAATFGIDPVVVHKQVFNHVPKGQMPSSASDYLYVLIQFANGQKTAVGVPWIKLDTLVVHKTNQVLWVTQNVSPEKIQMIREFFAANNIALVKMETKYPAEIQAMMSGTTPP